MSHYRRHAMNTGFVVDEAVPGQFIVRKILAFFCQDHPTFAPCSNFIHLFSSLHFHCNW